MALQSACRNAFLVVGYLDHTFALKGAHSRFRVGSCRQCGVALAGLMGGSGVSSEAFVGCSSDWPSEGGSLGDGRERFPLSCWCFPRSDPRRTLRTLWRTVCERFGWAVLQSRGYEARFVWFCPVFSGVVCLCSRWSVSGRRVSSGVADAGSGGCYWSVAYDFVAASPGRRLPGPCPFRW